MQYFSSDLDELYDHFHSSEKGLTSTQASRHLQKFGRNALTIKGTPLWRKILDPFLNIFMFILGLAAVVSLFAGESLDAIIIAVIMTISAVINYLQQFSAERILRALKNFDKQSIQVWRDGGLELIESDLIVPGDVIQLHNGQKVPADARLINANNVRSDESMLTGESAPAGKEVTNLAKSTPIYEQRNLLFSDTYLVSGEATALVIATGNHTEFGRIAALAGHAELSSPVQQKVDKLISQLIIAVAAASVLVFGLSIFRGIELTESIRFVLAMAVSAVPEGLPVAISVVLLLGARRLARHQALIRNISAIENIGIVTTIATDKTGTLTRNKLTVQDYWLPRKIAGAPKNFASLTVNNANGSFHDPLDSALHEFTKEDRTANNGTLINSYPFSQELAMSGNAWKFDDGYFVYVKGAPEKILERSKLSTSEKEKAQAKLIELTSQGYRVIAFAKLPLDKKPGADIDKLPHSSWHFLGYIGVADELRPEAKPAIAETIRAGVSVRMITGDHFETAFAIGKQLGLANKREEVFDCRQMSNMNDDELAATIEHIKVFSRVLPEYKHRILTILKQQEITAMTGDGVNDVPALTNAHIGVAMGSGSQIAKEAGDIVLLDDNFASIVRALRQGRIVFDNIQRMLLYLLSTNAGEVLTMIGALAIGLPVPLLPVQILWVNLVTDTTMVIPLGVESAEGEVMERPPRSPQRPVLGNAMLWRMGLVAVTMAVVTLVIFMYFWQFQPAAYARTIAFNVMVVMQWANAFNSRREWESIIGKSLFSNISFYVGLLASIALQVFIMYGPFASAMHLVDVNLQDLWISCGLAITSILIIGEAHKWYGRRFLKK